MARTPPGETPTPFAERLAEAGVGDTRFARLVNDSARREHGRELGLYRTSVSNWRRGMHPREPWVADLAAAVLSGLVEYTVTATDLGWRGEGGEPAGGGLAVAGDPVGVLRDLAGLAGRDTRAAPTVPFVPGGGAPVVLESLARVAEPVPPGPPGGAAAVLARETAAAFRRSDARLGGGGVHRQAAVGLHEAVRAVLAAGPPARDDLAALTELAQLVGWLATDCGLPGTAQRYHIQALALADYGGDGLLAGRVLVGMAELAGGAGRVREGLALARAALLRAGGGGPPVVRAMLHAGHADASARAGDGAGCGKALVLAEEAVSLAVAGEGPGWAVHYSEADVAACRGWCLLRSGEYAQAADAFGRALGVLPGARVRALACITAGRALACVYGGDVEGGLAAAGEVLEVGARVRSARLAGLVREVGAALAGHGGLVGVRQWRALAADWLRGPAGGRR